MLLLYQLVIQTSGSPNSIDYNQRISQIMQEHPVKSSLCRFYLRGLCIYSSKECQYAHGVWDLNYDYYKEGEPIQYDYHKNKDEGQKDTVKGPLIYKDLYEFQAEKIFSLEDLRENRTIRNEVRYQMHQQLFRQFMELMQIKHPDTPFTEEFLVREFTRVGFNKIMFGTMKFGHICSYVCDQPGSKYFKTMRPVPPDFKKVTVLARKAPEEDIISTYSVLFKKITQQAQQPLEENIIKKQLFTADLPLNVPPLNLVMKDKKMGFPEFISKVLKEDPEKVIFEASIESIQEQAVSYLKQALPGRLVIWQDIYNHLTKALKTNNGNIINQVKPHLVLQHNLFLFFPLTQFVYNSKINSHIFEQLKHQPCKCSFQKQYSEEELLIDMKNTKQLKEKQSYDINNFQTLMMCAPHILNSQILGVDLEGNLRKGGFVQMIQLNNGKNTFLIDIWDMNEKGDFQTFWLARKILRNVMANPKILKIFHDCRHDSIGLHEMIETCVVNVFDTSACETLIMQLNQYEKLFKKEKEPKDLLNDCKNTIAQCNNVKTPGLNEILKKYEARHGINQNKDKYHKMWSKGDISFFCQRPLDPEYREYCIKDVLDLPQVHAKMAKSLPEEAVNIAYWVSGLYAQSAYQPE